MNLLKALIWKEEEVFEKVAEYIKEIPTLTDGINYTFWNRKSPFIVQAHIDVVAGNKSYGHWDDKQQRFIKNEDKNEESKKPEIFRCRNIIGRKNGVLGGDDRAGVIAIMAIQTFCLEAKPPIPLPSILLTNGEESGGTGMKKFILDQKDTGEKLLEPVRLILALDRRGFGEYVYYSDPGTEVKEYIESFGFNKSHGSWSDSKDFTTKWRIPHVNLSVGYYDNHSERETIHLDETVLTAKRVCIMLKDPIDKRYEVVEKVYACHGGAYDYGEDYGYGGGWLNRDKDKEKSSQRTPIAAVAKRQKRCNILQAKNKFPQLCTFYPYLDYLLTDEAIKEGFHVISSPDAKGKSLMEWKEIFDIDNKDEVSALWQKEFSELSKLYIKSSVHGMFYLAAKITGSTGAAFAGMKCEKQEAEILCRCNKELNDRIKDVLIKEAEKKELVKNAGYGASVEDDYVSINGYCARYPIGECTGDCHGNRHCCNFKEGPHREEENGQFMIF